MENKNNLNNGEKFEVLEMDELLSTQGGGVDSIFDSIKNVILDLFGKDDYQDR